jgi:TRAP-type C4-dicarboxylate transport system substrate-binding protein
MGALSAPAAEQFTYTGPPITLRHSHFAPETHRLMKAVAAPWLEMVEKESNGKVIIKTYYNQTLHGARDGFKACVSDIVDFTPAYTMYQAGSFHLPHVLDLPFAFPSSKVACKVSEELYPKYFKTEYEKMGVYLANYNANGAYNFITMKPVRKLEDLKGMKIRSSGGSASKMIKKLGAVPVNLPATEAYNAFQRGVVDGVCFYDAGIVSYRVHEVGKYLTEVKINCPANSWAFNKKTFDKLPPEIKRFIYNMQRRLSQMYGEGYDREDEISREIIVKSGVKPIILPPAELARWKAAVEPLWDEFITENEALGLPARQLVKDLRGLSQKYSTWTQEQLMKEVMEHPMPGIIDGM